MTDSLMIIAAVVLPFLVYVLLGWLIIANRKKPDWQIVVCLSGLTVAISLVLLMAAKKIDAIRIGQLALEVNQKTDEVRRLTEQNKEMAKLTAKAIIISQKGPIMAAGYNAAEVWKPLEELLKAAGTPQTEIDQILERTNSTPH